MTGLKKEYKGAASLSSKKQQNNSFAKGLNFYKLFWVLFTCSFLGVVVETLWLLVRMHTLESRVGLVLGPFNLVYGFGAVLITLVLYPLRDKRDSLIFICGMVLGSAYEYMCSWLQELALGTVSWEYSALPYNLNGRINLQYAMFWGILSVVWLKFLFPHLSHWIETHVPNRIGKVLTFVLLAFLIFDSLLSLGAVWRMSVRHEGGKANNYIEEKLDEWYPDEKLHEIFPSMQFVE